MSVLFPKINKMPEWNFQPRFYDPEKEKRQQKLKQLQVERARKEKEKAAEESEENLASGDSYRSQINSQNPSDESKEEFVPTLHRGSFRELRDEKFQRKNTAENTSRIAFWLALLGMLIFVFYFLF